MAFSKTLFNLNDHSWTPIRGRRLLTPVLPRYRLGPEPYVLWTDFLNEFRPCQAEGLDMMMNKYFQQVLSR